MAKKLVNIFPGLRVCMSYNNETTEDLARIMGTSKDSTRRRLCGKADFDLSQIKILMNHYGKSFNELFETEEGKVV